MDGIVLLDKPQGLSSTQALQRVRRHLQAEKAGHAGTLDPMATGMLPLCFGQATKACGTLLGRRKAYSATVVLGVATDTGDAEGQPVAEAAVPAFDAARLEGVLASLRGERPQVPPMYSALKRDGRPLYELARQGRRGRARGAADHDRIARGDRRQLESGQGHARHRGRLFQGHLHPRARGGDRCGPRHARPPRGAAPALGRAVRAGGDGHAGGDRGLAGGSSRPGPWLAPVDAAFPDLPRLELDELEALYLCQGRTLARPEGLVEAAQYRAYGPDGGFLGLVEPAPGGRLQVLRLFVPGAGTDRTGSKKLSKRGPCG